MIKRHLAGLLLLQLGFALVLATASCGCGKRTAKRGTADQLVQSRLRYSPDEKGRTCYVMAEVENTGDLAIPRVRVTATLRSSTGKPRGVNHCFLENIKPAERRTFSMTVSAHDSFQHVDLSFADPDGK